MAENDKKKIGFNLSENTVSKLDLFADKLQISKSKIIEVLIRKLETNNFKDEFDFYSVVINKAK
jgi:hypothetical protein